MHTFFLIWVLRNCCAETVVAITVAILLVLFSLQRYGTGLVGGAFAPILLTWLLSIAAIGLVNALTMHPGVFAAVRVSSYPQAELHFVFAGSAAPWLGAQDASTYPDPMHSICLSGSMALLGQHLGCIEQATYLMLECHAAGQLRLRTC